jgi:hypothetical protein
MRTSFLLTLLAFLLAAPQADAQVRFLPYIGYQTNAGYEIDEDAEVADFGETTGGFLVGVGAEFGLTPGLLPIGLAVRPSVETAFLSGFDEEVDGTQFEISQDLLRVNLDLIGSFSPPLAPVGIYAGAGVTYVSYNSETSIDGDVVDEDDDGSDGSAVGANLLAGVRFGGGFISPFIQGRYSLANPTPDALQEEETGTDESELGNSFAVQAGISIGL